MDDTDMSGVVELAQRLTRKLATGRAIQLNARDMELLVLTGALRAITDAAASYSEQRTRERIKARPKLKPPVTTHHSHSDVEEALAAALAMTGGKR